jgi:hypothetical protein
MSIDRTPSGNPAVIVAGMHRSGTSLTASVLLDAGIHMGDKLLGAGHGNPVGHFEDNEIYEFHQRALVANGLGSEGFTAQAGLVVPAALLPEARRIIAHRRRHGGVWGWKEPRTTLFLEFWAEMVPEAMFLLVFRRPWEVVDSLFRRGDPTFALNPTLVVDIWLNYATHIERFLARHSDRCLLVELSQVVPDPASFLERVREKFGIRLGLSSERFREELLVQDVSSDRVRLLDAVNPEVLDCYRRLRTLAGSDSALPDAVSHRSPPLSLGGPALAEWRRAAAAEVQAAAAGTSLLAERDSAGHARQELQKCHEYAATLARDLQALQEVHATVSELEARHERTSWLVDQMVQEKETLGEKLAKERHDFQIAQQDLQAQVAAARAVVAEAERRCLEAEQLGHRERERAAAAAAELEATRLLLAESTAQVNHLQELRERKKAPLRAKVGREIRRIRDRCVGKIRGAGNPWPHVFGRHLDPRSEKSRSMRVS